MVDALVSNTCDFTVVRVRVSLPALIRRPGCTGALFLFHRYLSSRRPVVCSLPTAFFNFALLLMALILTNDGSHSVYSETYGVTYHSKYGAMTESAHVFIAAGLRYKAVVQREIAILETGFGTGLNAFMSWLEAERRNLQLRYVGLETLPIAQEEALVLNYAELLGVPERSEDFLGLHQNTWSVDHIVSEHFQFRKEQVSIETYEAVDAFDVVYFDAFAPQAQPELWTADVFARMYHALRPEGVLVTYCAQGAFKRTLKQVGFQVERLQGPPGKREMTRATKM